MTPINIKRNAVNPRTTLDGIPEEFIRWAETTHGWTREHLLLVGTAWAHEQGNALDYLLANFVWSTKTACCGYCNATEHLHHGPQGYLVCDKCSSPKWAQHDFEIAAFHAGGFVKQEFPAQSSLF